MKFIRMVEEAIAEAYPLGEMRCPTHLSIGQEAAGSAFGIVSNMDDYVVSSHRAHAHYLGKGGDLYRMLAELHGKEDGCSGGKGGSMHLVDSTVGFMGSTAIVGNTIPVGVGLALAIQLRKTDQISAVFFGDGAVEEGVFYESINFAAIRKLPVLFLCENNLYSVYSPLSVRQPSGRSIQKMVAAMGVPGEPLREDPISIYEGIEKAVDHVRTRRQPFFVEIPAYRWREHCGPNEDDSLGYRTEQEISERKEKDPLGELEREMISSRRLDTLSVKRFESECALKITDAFEAARKAPYPQTELMLQDVFSNA